MNLGGPIQLYGLSQTTKARKATRVTCKNNIFQRTTGNGKQPFQPLSKRPKNTTQWLSSPEDYEHLVPNVNEEVKIDVASPSPESSDSDTQSTTEWLDLSMLFYQKFETPICSMYWTQSKYNFIEAEMLFRSP